VVEHSYIRFLRWAEERKAPFTYLDVELALGTTREAAVQLVLLAVDNKRVGLADSMSYLYLPGGFPGKPRDA
jgi:hypothetical protein